MPTLLLTGAGRGIGLEFVRQSAADGWHVVAGCRNPAAADELAHLARSSAGRITVHPLDVTDHAGIDRLAAELKDTPIDLLLNNAGVGGRQPFGACDYAAWTEAFRINTLGPTKMAEAFVQQVAASDERKIVTLTSMMGSIGDNQLGGFYAYRSTKAGANAVVKSLALDLKRHGIIAVAMHPGWVRTDMGGPRAPVEVAASVASLRRIIAGLTPEQSGQFINYDGSRISW